MQFILSIVRSRLSESVMGLQFCNINQHPTTTAVKHYLLLGRLNIINLDYRSSNFVCQAVRWMIVLSINNVPHIIEYNSTVKSLDNGSSTPTGCRKPSPIFASLGRRHTLAFPTLQWVEHVKFSAISNTMNVKHGS